MSKKTTKKQNIVATSKQSLKVNKKLFLLGLPFCILIPSVLLVMLRMFVENGELKLSLIGSVLRESGTFALITAFSLVTTLLWFKKMLGVDSRESHKDDLGRKHEHLEDSTSQGSAAWMSEEEEEQFLEKKNIYQMEEYFYGYSTRDGEEDLLVSIKKRIGINDHVFLAAPTGSGKTQSIIINWIIQCIRRGESAIVTDIKGELLELLSEYAKAHGYIVRIINLSTNALENSDTLDFFAHIKNVSGAQILAEAIISNGSPDKDFWSQGAMGLLAGLILYIKFSNDYTEEEKNIVTLTHLATKPVSELLELYEKVPQTHICKRQLGVFCDSKEVKIQESTLQTLKTILQPILDEDLGNILRGGKQGNMDFKDIANGKKLYFVRKDPMNPNKDFILSVIYTVMINELVSYAEGFVGKRLPNNVNLFLDECANAGRIPDFGQKMSLIRSYGIKAVIVIQTMEQLRKVYPDDMVTIMSNCGTWVISATSDPEFTEQIQNMIGKETVETSTVGYEENVTEVVKTHGEYNRRLQEVGRFLMEQGEIRRLDPDLLLILPQTLQPFIVRKMWYFKDSPAKDSMIPIHERQHCPYWRLMRDNLVPKDFDYDKEPSVLLEFKPQKIEEIVKPIIEEFKDPALLKTKAENVIKTKDKMVRWLKDYSGLTEEVEAQLYKEEELPEVKKDTKDDAQRYTPATVTEKESQEELAEPVVQEVITQKSEPKNQTEYKPVTVSQTESPKEEPEEEYEEEEFGVTDWEEIN